MEFSAIHFSKDLEQKNKKRVGKGEFHPRTSLRTVRESLDSYGSSQPSR